jgi:hypothetical protein
MKFFANVVFAAVAGAAAAQASDPVAVYALVDKVVMEPNADKPEQIQIWGVFSTAKPNDRNLYETPQRGYLYFKLPSTKEDLARNEWADFKSIAGKREVVGFGNRYMVKLRVRKADEKAKAPDVYQVELGLVKIKPDTDYAPVKALFEYSNH